MDIARLPGIGHITPSYPATPRGPAGRERVLEPVTETSAARPAREPAEKVVQGELLQRRRAAYSATQDYLNSRWFDATADTDTERRNRANPGQSGRALGAYLSHTREFIQPDVNRGKQVDYFV
ncbi:MAG: hypothetical protein ACLGH6_13030 [Gammaproteobacteria bacterium]